MQTDAYRLWSSGCRSRYQGPMGRLKFLKRPFCIIGELSKRLFNSLHIIYAVNLKCKIKPALGILTKFSSFFCFKTKTPYFKEETVAKADFLKIQ